MMINFSAEGRAANSFLKNMKRRKMIFEKYQVLLENGLTYMQITERMYARMKKPNSPEGYFLQHIMENLSEGKSFAEALNGWATANEITIISACESAGSPAKGFEQCVELMEKLIEMRSVIISSSIYPGFLMLALLGVIMGFAKGMVPILSDFSDPDTWPSHAKTLRDFTTWITDNIIMVIIGLIGLGYGMMKSLPTFTGTIRDKFLDKIPPYSLYKEIQAGLFLSSLSTLLKSGMTFANSLEFIESEAPKYVQDKIVEVIDNTNEGRSEGEAINIEFIGDVGDDIEDFSMGSDIGTAMAKLGDAVVKEKIDKIKASAGLLKFFAMIIVFVMVIWSYISFISITQSLDV